MSIVRAVLWAGAAMLFAAFAIGNWTPVPLVFGATEVMVRLPVLLLAALLAGYLPAWIRYRLAQRRVNSLTLAAAAVPMAYVPPRTHPAALDQAQPTIVPPGCG